jgi:hypothetical protein
MKSIVATATLAFPLAAGPALADEDGRFYAGVGVGQTNLHIGGFESGAIDGSDTSYQIFGGLRVNPYFSLELFYSRFGKFDGTVIAGGDEFDLELEFKGYGPYVVGVLPIGKFELFAKLGYLFHSADLRSIMTSNGQISDAKGDSEDAVYGAGVGVVVLDGLELRLGYEVLDISAFGQPDVIWLTGAWRF